MLSILLIGAGQIGSRHLQGLASTSLSFNIIVVDSSDTSLSIAKIRWKEVGGDQSSHKISWFRVLPKNIKSFDLAIVATSSKNRAILVEQVVQSASVNYWVLEKVLAQSKQELEFINSTITDAKGIWVNTPRRLTSWHQQLKLKFYDQGPLTIKKVGGMWGLACNSIHFIDLVAWWTSESLLSVNTDRLDQTWFKAKRSGYFEITGELLISFSGGSKLILQSNPNNIEDIINVELSNKSIWKINESKAIASSSKKDILNGKYDLQSDITGPMVTEIFTQGTCGLPNLKESSKQHAIFLDSMLKHWNTFNKSNDKVVPIT
jgi:hypothetical protein|tara:strand:- start:2913 stop:3869 length:957 start_codon:yes stop_codon:yes gene_type:complete